jgi:hypothetical protein
MVKDNFIPRYGLFFTFNFSLLLHFYYCLLFVYSLYSAHFTENNNQLLRCQGNDNDCSNCRLKRGYIG